MSKIGRQLTRQEERETSNHSIVHAFVFHCLVLSEISPASIQNRARKGTERTTIAQMRRLNRDFGNPKREGGGRRTVATRDSKRGLASAVSSNRLDNLQEALEPRCTNRVVYIERVHAYIARTYTHISVTALHTAVRGFSCCYFLASK